MRLNLSSYTFNWAVGVPGSETDNPIRVCGLPENAISMGINLVQFADNLPLESLQEEELCLKFDFAK